MNLRGSITEQARTIGPDAVKRIFDLNASGVSQPKIPAMINSEFSDANVGDSLVRAVLHREIFEDVEIDDKIQDIVSRRFRKGIKRRAKTVTNGSGTPCRQADTELLHDVLDARLAYQKVLDKAVEAGMKEESIIAWCDVVARGDLR